MDTITHALSGALLARAVCVPSADRSAPSVRQRMWAGAVAAAFPDTDLVAALVSPIAYLLHHRGITHSFLVLPVWAVVLAWLIALVTRKGDHWRDYLLVCALGVGIHILGDLITTYGTMVLSPISDRRFVIGTTFIIDLILTGLIVAGLLAGRMWRASRAPAVASLALVVAYIGFQGWMREQAIDVGRAYAETNGLPEAQVAVVPRPPLPTNWTVFVRSGDAYRYAHVNLWRTSMPAAPGDAGFLGGLHGAYLPVTRAVWERKARFGDDRRDESVARQAWEQNGFAFYRWFAAFPAVHHVDRSNPATCVWFEDLRFFIPGRSFYPFRYGMCQEAYGSWAPYRIGSGGAPAPLR